jgi:hypothetical protein
LVITAVIILINGGLTGNRPLALLYMGLGVPVAISVGILMGSMTQSTKQCSGWLSLVMMFLLIPSWFLTLINLPEHYSSIIHVIPTHFMVQGLSDALNHVSVTASNTLNLTVWTLFTVAMVAITAWRVHHKPQSIIA